MSDTWPSPSTGDNRPKRSLSYSSRSVFSASGRKTGYREKWLPKLSTRWKPCGRAADYSAKWRQDRLN